MAGPACMSDDGNQSVFVGTFLQNGDAVAVCGDCLPGFAIALAAQTNGIPVDTLGGLMAELVADEPEDPAAAGAEIAAPPQATTAPTSDVDPTAGEHDPSGESDQAGEVEQDQDPPARPAKRTVPAR